MPDQEELFEYTADDIERLKVELASDVVKLNNLEDERHETVKGYTNAIKLLRLQIRSKADAIKGFRLRTSQKMQAI